MPYEQIIFSQAKSRVAALLGDPNMVFFASDEVARALYEAFRTWNSVAQYWRARGSFNTASDDVFIDMGPVLQSGSQYYLQRNIQDSDIVSSVCDALMESQPVFGSWTGTDKFTMSDVLGAIEDATNEFLVRTSCVTHHVTQAATIPPPVGRVVLDDEDISDIRRLDWKDTPAGTYRQLWRTDEWALNATRRFWSTDASDPESFAVTSTPQLSVQLAPVPLNGGELDMLVINNNATLTGLGTVVDIPNDFAWVVKWGALARLLNQDGQVRDPERAAYCQQRFEEGVAIATASAASVLQLEVNGVPVQVESVFDLDSTRPGWRNSSGQPDQVGLCGLNMLALAPRSNGVYSIVADVVTNAPLPTDLEYVDLGKEFMDTVTNYAQHVLSFKMGGPEFQATDRYRKELYDAALAYNAKLRANGQFYDVTQARATREKVERPARKDVDA